MRKHRGESILRHFQLCFQANSFTKDIIAYKMDSKLEYVPFVDEVAFLEETHTLSVKVELKNHRPSIGASALYQRRQMIIKCLNHCLIEMADEKPDKLMEIVSANQVKSEMCFRANNCDCQKNFSGFFHERYEYVDDSPDAKASSFGQGQQEKLDGPRAECSISYENGPVNIKTTLTLILHGHQESKRN